MFFASHLRKIIAAILLLVYVFNFFGYSFVFDYFLRKADQNTAIMLDNERYNRRDLREIKIPVRLPYVTEQRNYERVDGQMEYQGVVYNYVKRRISTDTIYIQYLPDAEKTRLTKAKSLLEKDLTSTPSRKNDAKKRASFSDKYDQIEFFWQCLAYPVMQLHTNFYLLSPLQDTAVAIPSPPPQIA